METILHVPFTLINALILFNNSNKLVPLLTIFLYSYTALSFSILYLLKVQNHHNFAFNPDFDLMELYIIYKI